MLIDAFKKQVSDSVKFRRHREGFTRVASLATVEDSYLNGLTVEAATEIAFEDTFLTHGYAASQE